MLSSMERILTESPFIAVFAVFWAGALASLGLFLLVRIPVVFGLITGASGSRKKSILSLLLFIIGLVIGYIILGMLLGNIGDIIAKFTLITKYLYAILGILIVLAGIFLSGLLKFKFLRHHYHIINKLNIMIYFVAFLSGIVLALIDMPTCPHHETTMQIISRVAIEKGSFAYSIPVFISFSIGQSLPMLIIGILTIIFKYVTPRFEKIEGYMHLIAGNILIVFGIYFILIA